MRTRIVPKTELRSRIKDELAGLGDDTLVVTDRGRPLAVAVSVDRWNSLQETLEDLEDSVAVLEHRFSPGRARPLESVLSEIEAGKLRVRRQVRKKS
jgi:prevent-host-death family protein